MAVGHVGVDVAVGRDGRHALPAARALIEYAVAVCAGNVLPSDLHALRDAVEARDLRCFDLRGSEGFDGIAVADRDRVTLAHAVIGADGDACGALLFRGDSAVLIDRRDAAVGAEIGEVRERVGGSDVGHDLIGGSHAHLNALSVEEEVGERRGGGVVAADLDESLASGVADTAAVADGGVADDLGGGAVAREIESVAAAFAHAVPLDRVRLGAADEGDALGLAVDNIVVGDLAERGGVGADAVLARVLDAVVVDVIDLAGIDLHAVDLGADDGVVGQLVRLRIVAEDDAVVISARRLDGVLGADDHVGGDVGVAGVLNADAVAADVDVVVVDAHAVDVVVALRKRAAAVKGIGAVVLTDVLADDRDALTLIGGVDIADRADVVERVAGDVDVRLFRGLIAVGHMSGGAALIGED